MDPLIDDMMKQSAHRIVGLKGGLLKTKMVAGTDIVLYRTEHVRGAELLERHVENNLDDAHRRRMECRGQTTIKLELYATLVLRYHTENFHCSCCYVV